MKKFKLVGLSMLLSVGALAGCTKPDDPKPDPEHTHTFEEAWTSDANKHWHKATCGHDVKGSEAAHVDSNSDFKCDVCGFVMHTHSFDLSNWSSDASSHWHAATCGHDVKDSLGAHKDENGDFLCDVCGFVMHEHTFEAKWTTNESSHWHAATCEHTDLKSEEGNHVDKDGNEKCDVCGYDMHKHTFAEAWSSNESQHWHDATCGHDVKDSLGNHVDADKNFQCDICGKLLPEVVSIEINGPQDPVELGSVVDLSCAIVVGGGAESDVTWSLSNDNASLSRRSGESVQLTALKEGSVVVTVTSNFDASKSAELTIELIKSSKVAWTDAEKELMQEKLGIVLPFFPGSFAWGFDEASGMLVALSNVGSDVENVKTVLDALEYPKEEISGGIIYTLPGAEGFAVDVGVILTADGKAEVLAYAYRNAWPSDVVASYIGDWTDETVPAAAGENFEVSEKTSPYNALVIDITGDASAYLSKLEEAGWEIDDLTGTYGYYDCYSPKGYLELAVFADDGMFEIQLMLVNPPVESWPAKAVASYIGDWTDEVVPAAEGTSFEVSEKTSPYNALVIDITGDASAYLSKLEEAGWEIDDLGAYYDCYSPKGYLELAVFADDGMFEIQLMLVNPPVESWPAEAVASYIGDWTDEVVPAAEGTSFEVSEKTSPYNALIIDITGDVDAYISTLEGAEWQINDLTETYGYYDCYSPKNYIELAVFPGVGVFEIQLMLVNPPAPEFPAEALAEFIGDHTTDTVPSPIGTGFENGISNGVFWANITGGDASDYMETLALAGYVSHEKLDLGSSVHVFTSESGALQLVLIESTGSFELDVYKVVAPQYDEYPADLINAYTGAVTDEVLPAPAADGFDVIGVEEDFYGDEYYAFVARYGDCYSYAYALYLDSWIVDTSNYEKYGLIQAASPNGTIQVQLWDSGLYFEVDVYASEAATFPSEAIAEFIGDHTETAVPVPTDGAVLEDHGSEDGIVYELVMSGSADAYISQLEEAGFTEADYDSWYGQGYLSEDELLEIYIYDMSGAYYIDIMLVEPLVPADFPTEAISAFLAGKTDETVPECFATKFEVHDYGTYLSIEADNASVSDYMATLKAAGWDADYDSYAYYNYATSPEESIKITLVDHSSYGYVEIIIEYLEPKLTEWPTDSVAEALGDNAKTALPAVEGSGLKFDFFDEGSDSCIIDVYGGALPADYVTTLTNAGFEITDGSAQDYYWYLLSADKTVKVVVLDYLADGEDYFEIRAFGQVPTWTGTSFDPAVVEEALGLNAGFIPAIADGTKFSFSQPSDDSFKVTVESGANYDNFISALGEAGFVETSPNSGTFTKDNVVAVVTILNPFTQKYSIEYSVQNSPTPVGEWPIEDIAALLGDTRAAYLPEAVGATSVIVTGSDGDCTISITGVSAADYKQALLDNGFTFDGMSYSKEDLYVDVTGSGDSCTVNAYYFDF